MGRDAVESEASRVFRSGCVAVTGGWKSVREAICGLYKPVGGPLGGHWLPPRSSLAVGQRLWGNRTAERSFTTAMICLLFET